MIGRHRGGHNGNTAPYGLVDELLSELPHAARGRLYGAGDAKVAGIEIHAVDDEGGVIGKVVVIDSDPGFTIVLFDVEKFVAVDPLFPLDAISVFVVVLVSAADDACDVVATDKKLVACFRI